MSKARYNDGRKAETHEVTVSLGDAVLAIRDDDGLTRARWPLTEIRPLGDEHFGRGEERLIVADRGFARSLRKRLPRTSRRGLWRTIGIAGGTVAAVVLFFWLGLPLVAGRVAEAVPPRWEQASGAWLEKQVVGVLGGNRVCTGKSGRRALDALVDRLAAVSPPRLPLTVTVVDSRMVNAFALPGGRIVVFRGLITFAEHPNELAGVLAHEMAHGDLRHPTEVAIKRIGGTMIVSLLVGDVFGGSAFGILAQTLISSAYSREAERAADAQALATMHAADLDSAPVAAFFTRLAKQETDTPGFRQAMAFLETHPPSDQRAEEMRGAAGTEIDPETWRLLTTICHDTAAY